MAKWQQLEKVMADADSLTPDELAEAYTEVTTDLAFAQTQFPGSEIERSLNQMALVMHNTIYRNKREKRSRIITFWTREVPLVMWESRRLLLASFIIFVVSVLIGVVSTLGDPEFPRVILGDYYVDMTIQNIKNDNPMGVYGSEAAVPMFLSITLNNVLVTLRCFAVGLLTSICTGLMLFYNGIMVGAFQAFFYERNLLWESSMAIWLHGTLEISSIIVAGAAGLSLGNGWLFPGTYSRLASFKRGAKRGLKIVVGTLPIFVVAAFIESFVTRHTELSAYVRVSIILLSLAFVVGYFVVLPRRLYGRKAVEEQEEKEPLI